MCPTLYKECVGSLMSHRFITCARACETGTMFYRPYPRILESPTVCRCYYKGSTFSSVVYRPWVLVWPGFEPRASRSADRHFSHWANRAAVLFDKQAEGNLAVDQSLVAFTSNHFTYQSQKLKFQLVFWANSSHISLSQGHFLLVSEVWSASIFSL